MQFEHPQLLGKVPLYTAVVLIIFVHKTMLIVKSNLHSNCNTEILKTINQKYKLYSCKLYVGTYVH